MLYKSTRGHGKKVDFAQAVMNGIAPDGGLYVPDTRLIMSKDEINSLSNMNYHGRTELILKKYMTGFCDDEIRDCILNAYTENKFSNSSFAHVEKISDKLSILELFHGPTSAFKDMALQILPHFMVKALDKKGEKRNIVILVATSGDTGKAALEGFKDVNGISVVVFYPEHGVSEVQKRQMITQEGSNVQVIGVKGNFDDAQNGVKDIFSDMQLAEDLDTAGYVFSSANSINWGRLLPQIVYYFSAYADLIKDGYIQENEKINFAVPTGNFGNILAAYYAMKMGLPVNKLICASNDNNVLTEFINTGAYNKNRTFYKTVSPSMDILISSNLERLLYEISGHDTVRVSDWMSKLKSDGHYKVDKEIYSSIKDVFYAGYATEKETIETIAQAYKDYKYVADTHTAVGLNVYHKYINETNDMTKTVVVSTASPFKFNESVAKAILGNESINGLNEFQITNLLSDRLSLQIPEGLKNLDKREVKHSKICEIHSMKDEVREGLM